MTLKKNQYNLINKLQQEVDKCLSDRDSRGACWLAGTSCSWKGCIFSAKHNIYSLVKCHFLVVLHSSWAVLSTCVASMAAVQLFVFSGLTLMNVRLFTRGFVIALVDSLRIFPMTHFTRAQTKTHTHKITKKMRSRGERKEFWKKKICVLQ